MGTDPVKYLVAPRMLACLLLRRTHRLPRTCSVSIGGWFISVFTCISTPRLLSFSAYGVDLWDVGCGIIKGFFFGGAMAVISCYKVLTAKKEHVE